MDFLSNLGITNETIQSIKHQCIDDVEISQFYLYKSSIESSVLLMRRIGVRQEAIEEILKENFRIFLPGEEYLKDVLAKINDINSFVEKLNSDPIQYCDYLY